MSEKLVSPKILSTAKPEKTGRIAKKNTTIVTKCDCVSSFQDEKYGKGMRVKNSTGAGYRCTVCRK